LDYLPLPNLIASARVTFMRHGENVVAADGTLLKNVGGDPLQPHRDSDPETKRFLDGDLVKTQNFQLQITWEIVRQIWLDGIVAFDGTRDSQEPERRENRFADLRVRAIF
jgi:hypothetical protein